MKFILMAAFALMGVWLWRGSREAGRTPRNAPPAAPPRLQNMVSCPVCDVHVPKADAVAGRQGFYCCAEHRQRAEG